MAMKRFLISMAVFFMFSGLARAMGLRSNFGMLFLENLGVGKTYSIFDLAAEPLKVVNVSDSTVDLEIEIGYPAQHQLRPGFEAIPDISWVKLEKSSFRLEPGQMALADFTISIPKDENYVNKMYQFYIWSHVVKIAAVGGGMPIFPAVKGFVCFTTSPVKPGVSEEEAEKVRANLVFSVVPHQITLNGIELGKKYDIGKFTGKEIKLINPNDEAFTYKMEPITVARSMMRLAGGFEDCPDPSFLTIEEPVFEVEPNSIKKKKIYLHFPKEDSYRDRKYEFIIYTYVLNQKVITGVYTDVFVITKP